MTRPDTISPERAQLLDARFRVLRANLDFIAGSLDRTAALYPMMSRVIYQDFETLVATIIEDHTPLNDV